MAAEDLSGSLVRTNVEATPIVRVNSSLAGGRVHYFIDTVEVTAAAEANSTYTLGISIPSNAIILPGSTLYWDDLDAAGSPTLDIGIKSPNSTFTADADALNDGLDCTSAGSAAVLKTPITMLGTPLWDYVNGVTADPQELVDVYVSLVDAAASLGGTVTLYLEYVVD